MAKEDVPWVTWAADLVESISQGALPVRFEGNVEVESSANGWVAQTLPVDWNGLPGVHNPHVIPRFDWCCEAGEG